jgi:hypothetical protein
VTGRVPRLLPFPALAGFSAAVVGAAAAHDPSFRPRFDLLLLYTLYAVSVILLATHADQRFRAPRALARMRTRTVELVVLSALAGLLLIFARGWPGFWAVGGLALLSGAFVTGPRLTDTGLGGAIAALVLGPVITGGAAIAIVGHATLTAVAVGVPVGLVADAARRARENAAAPAGSPAPPWFAADLVLAYGAIPVAVLLGALPWATLLTALTLPLAVAEFVRARRGTYAWPDAARRMRQLHLALAVLLAVSVFAARVVATRAV